MLPLEEYSVIIMFSNITCSVFYVCELINYKTSKICYRFGEVVVVSTSRFYTLALTPIVNSSTQ